MKLCKTGLFVLFTFITVGVLAAQGPVRGEFRFIWYNVENLFYPEDDSLEGDEEFTPEGLRRWTWSRYRAKLTALAKVIIAAGRGDPPELVALCEVENAQVLEDLCAHPVLLPYEYAYLHRESPDHRGMDVACLLRRGRIETSFWEIRAFAYPVLETRDIMHLGLAWGSDTLDLYLVHLLSKYGGAGATASLRSSQTEQLVQFMDSVCSTRQRGWIMAAGDFNEPYTGYAMEAVRTARFGSDSLCVLLPENGHGTYKYQGSWSPIDQVLVLQSMPRGSIYVSCLNLSLLLTEDLNYGGMKPKRCYEGMQYKGGISDHLPLVIDLNPSRFLVPGE